MIKISNSKPRLIFVQAHNDMSHFTPSRWEVCGGMEFLLNDDLYQKIVQFTDPSLKDYNGPTPGTLEAILESEYGSRIERTLKLNPNGTMLWQFNALSTSYPKKVEYIRMMVVFGEYSFYFLTVWDKIKVPFLTMTAKILNLLRSRKIRKEIADWNKFLDSVRARAQVPGSERGT